MTASSACSAVSRSSRNRVAEARRDVPQVGVERGEEVLAHGEQRPVASGPAAPAPSSTKNSRCGRVVGRVGGQDLLELVEDQHLVARHTVQVRVAPGGTRAASGSRAAPRPAGDSGGTPSSSESSTLSTYRLRTGTPPRSSGGTWPTFDHGQHLEAGPPRSAGEERGFEQRRLAGAGRRVQQHDPLGDERGRAGRRARGRGRTARRPGGRTAARRRGCRPAGPRCRWSSPSTPLPCSSLTKCVRAAPVQADMSVAEQVPLEVGPRACRVDRAPLLGVDLDGHVA